MLCTNLHFDHFKSNSINTKIMEELYCLIPDNISEIISVTYNLRIALYVSTIAKSFSCFIYYIPKLKLFDHHNKYNFDRFNKLKKIVLHGEYTIYPQSTEYYHRFSNLSNVNKLRIEYNLSNCSDICLTHFTNLTKLTFNWNTCEQIVFDYIRLKHIIGIHFVNPSVFNFCTNVEKLQLNLMDDDTFFVECIYPKLTHLTINFISNPFQKFHIHIDYFHNIVELHFDDGHIDFAKYTFPVLTSLVLLRINQNQQLNNMPRLKIATLSKKENKNVTVNLFNLSSLEYLNIDNFNCLILQDNYRTNSVIFRDDFINLKIIKIIHQDMIYLHADAQHVRNLKSLESIEFAEDIKTEKIIICLKQNIIICLKQNIIDALTVNSSHILAICHHLVY